MQEIIFDNNLLNFFFIVMGVILFAQAYALMRIRNILQAIAINLDSISYFCRKLSSQNIETTQVSKISKTCQFCKHRLAYINTSKSKNEEDDFYHRCRLRNIDIDLGNTCVKFELETKPVK